jgi:hypothetical protein
MRTYLISIFLVAGCTSSEPQPLAAADLIGTWTGVASSGTTERYVFGADATLAVGTVDSADGFSSQLQGTFSIADPMLTWDLKSTDGVGNPIRLQITSEPYLSAGVFCDQPLRGDTEAGGVDGIVGSWTSTATTQQVDVSGMPIGDPTANVADLALNADGTFSTHESSGTYVVDHDTVTTSYTDGDVVTVQSYTFVDGTVLCDPALHK